MAVPHIKAESINIEAPRTIAGRETADRTIKNLKHQRVWEKRHQDDVSVHSQTRRKGAKCHIPGTWLFFATVLTTSEQFKQVFAYRVACWGTKSIFAWVAIRPVP
jgi:hypothetical protein